MWFVSCKISVTEDDGSIAKAVPYMFGYDDEFVDQVASDFLEKKGRKASENFSDLFSFQIRKNFIKDLGVNVEDRLVVIVFFGGYQALSDKVINKIIEKLKEKK